jgi:hypothetical protein
LASLGAAYGLLHVRDASGRKRKRKNLKEDRRGVEKRLWEDANLTRAERGEAAWKEVRGALGKRSADSDEGPSFNPSDNG